jgi:hypothetical protein
MTAFSTPEQTALTSAERVLRAAEAAYLGRYRGQSRLHTGPDLKIFLTWCVTNRLDPLRIDRTGIERYVRWLQEPGATSRRPFPAAGHGGRLLPHVCHRSDPAALSGRLRRPATGTCRITHSRDRASAVRSPDHRGPPVRGASTTSPWSRCWAHSGCGSSKPAARTSATSARSTATAC